MSYIRQKLDEAEASLTSTLSKQIEPNSALTYGQWGSTEDVRTGFTKEVLVKKGKNPEQNKQVKCFYSDKTSY